VEPVRSGLRASRKILLAKLVCLHTLDRRWLQYFKKIARWLVQIIKSYRFRKFYELFRDRPRRAGIDQRRVDVLCNHDQELPIKEKCLSVCVCVCVSHHILIWVHMFWHLTYVLTRCHVTDIPCVLVLTRCHWHQPCSDTLSRHWNQLRWSWRGGARAAAVRRLTGREEKQSSANCT